MPPQVPQTPPGYIPPFGIYVGVILAFLLMSAILLVGWLIYDKFIAPKKARQKKIQNARWDILEREKELRDRKAWEAELAEILSVDYKEFRV